jgi:acyl-CoA reductase-like NAD-dependent aldehyde dehydrogenase
MQGTVDEGAPMTAVTQPEARVIQPGTMGHWAGGAPFAGTSERTADVTNPATGQVTGRVALADRADADADAVIRAAAAAARAWGSTSLARRTQVMSAFRELLNARKDELAALITAEHGKVHSDALGEVSRGQEVVEFACGLGHLFGDTHAHGAEGVHFFTRGKVVTSRWIDPANRPDGGLELGFPQNV